MKIKSLFMLALLAVPGMAPAQNTLTAAETTIPQTGGELKFNFTFAEENVYSTYQFKIETPEGVVYDTNEDDDVECTLGACHTSSHAATVHWNSSIRTLTVGVTSMSSALLKGTSGELISIPLLETEQAVGTALPFKVTGITYIRQDGTKDYLDDLEFNITVGEPDDGYIKFDETSTTVPEASNGAVDVRVKRTISANQWSTICLPFAVNAAQMKDAFGNDVQLEDFVDYDIEEDEEENVVGITVNFETAAAIEANHPYIIKVSEAVTEFTVDGVTINPEDDPCVEYDNGKTGKKREVYGRFVGTYVADFDFYNAAKHYPLFLNGNKFYYATENTKHMKAFRAYFDFVDNLAEAEGAEVKLYIDGFETRVDGLQMKDASGTIYDLSGRKIEKPQQRGVYIVNGKKILKY